MSIGFAINGIGLLGPGLANWSEGRATLAAQATYQPTEMKLAASELLPPAERRRMTDTVKLALVVGSEAIAQSDIGAEATPTVFTSSGGDGATIISILDILASAEREVSPTRFHNSVHNAPSGYWSIATHAHEPSTSLCAYDYSFGAGLLEAVGLVTTERRPVLLVSYDVPYAAVLHRERPILGMMGVALLLVPSDSPKALARGNLCLSRRQSPQTTMEAPRLEDLRSGNPTGRALPLLAAIARGAKTEVVIEHMAGNRLILDLAGSVSDGRS